jgi:hypothetical protein
LAVNSKLYLLNSQFSIPLFVANTPQKPREITSNFRLNRLSAGPW